MIMMRPARLASSLAALALLLIGCAPAGLRSNDDVQRILPAAAYEAANNGTAVIYDVRPRESFEILHVAGAEALPEPELDSLAAQLPADKDLILYCT